MATLLRVAPSLRAPLSSLPARASALGMWGSQCGIGRLGGWRSGIRSWKANELAQAALAKAMDFAAAAAASSMEPDAAAASPTMVLVLVGADGTAGPAEVAVSTSSCRPRRRRLVASCCPVS